MKKIFFSLLLAGLFSSQAMASDYCTIVISKSQRVFVHNSAELNQIECTGNSAKDVPAFFEKGKIYHGLNPFKAMSVMTKEMEDNGWTFLNMTSAEGSTIYDFALIFKK